MINKIQDAVCLKLNAVFGDGYEIYTEQSKQGLEEPCFFVSCINPRNKQMVGKRYVRSHLFCVQFFPTEEEPKSQCYTMLEQLYDVLDYIDVDGFIMGTGMHGEIVDGVLSFFVNYDVFLQAIEEKERMGELFELNIEMKG